VIEEEEMSRSLLKQLRKDRGVSSVEYIIILVLVALTGIAVFKIFGGQIKTKMTTANTTMQNDVNPQ
jgi:Flp pilus assembly pilin Flp